MWEEGVRKPGAMRKTQQIKIVSGDCFSDGKEVSRNTHKPGYKKKSW